MYSTTTHTVTWASSDLVAEALAVTFDTLQRGAVKAVTQALPNLPPAVQKEEVRLRLDEMRALPDLVSAVFDETLGYLKATHDKEQT